MKDKQDFWKLITGEKYEETIWTQSFEDILDEQWTSLNSKYPLRVLGFDKYENALRITEEQRPHIHVIGTTQEGKSKFIERLIRGDIKRGIGCCLIDPTTGGKTVYDVLKYCAYKNIKKVCLIDPFHRHEYNTVTGLSPFLYTSDKRKSDYLKEMSVSDFMDTTRVLFNAKDPSEQMRIERYLPAVLNVLYDNNCPLRDVKYFTSRLYKIHREKMLEMADNDDRMDLEEAFSDRQAYLAFQSTISRMMRFFKRTVGMMFAPFETVDFMKMIEDDWIILVNLDAGFGFDTLDSRLLGTFVINQITTSIERLNKRGRYKPYYLYIDEAADYANRKLAAMLSKKQQTGLKITLAHQYNAQFEDNYVLKAVEANSKITAQFNLMMVEDRDAISRQFYGGDIDPKDASYANSNLAVQHAVIKSLKGDPVRVKIPNVKEPPITRKELKAYVQKLYLSQPWYHNARELKQQLDDIPVQTYSKGSKSRKMDDSQPVNKTVISGGIQERQEKKGLRQDKQKPPDPPPTKPIKI